MALDARGTGRPDFTQGAYGIGPDRLPYPMPLSSKGSKVVTETPIIGTIAHVKRLGTLTYLSTLGTITSRGYAPISLRDRVHLGQGSIWLGSWVDVGGYRTKTFSILGRGTPGGGAGSFAIIAGMVGTGPGGFTGTYYGPALIGAGSFTTKSFSETMRYVRPYFRKSGTYSGTVSVALGRQF